MAKEKSNEETLTPLGYYLGKRPLSKAKLGRMTGINKDRIGSLCNDLKARATVDEIYLIALAFQVPYSEIIDQICFGLELRPEEEWNLTAKKK